ncbi:protein held out wings-like isoform X1 [Diaphorina citri]|uniref:Protein held out wings-like isoform X1 n=1 Tax=Diaphorina citri TaxID=121845 RepID=A0A3Q0IP33_DIACI|nr:protein held out wings-like isoform X1 [Diaphorina citri]
MEQQTCFAQWTSSVYKISFSFQYFMELDNVTESSMKILNVEFSSVNPQQAEGEDELKKRQLMELAIINGTYRDNNAKVLAAAAACDEEWRRMAVAAAQETQRLLSPGMPGMATQLRTPTATPLGAPLILSPRIPAIPTSAASLLNGSPGGQLMNPADAHQLIYTPYADYANYAALTGSPLLTEYASADHSVHHYEVHPVIQFKV